MLAVVPREALTLPGATARSRVGSVVSGGSSVELTGAGESTQVVPSTGIAGIPRLTRSVKVVPQLSARSTSSVELISLPPVTVRYLKGTFEGAPFWAGGRAKCVSNVYSALFAGATEPVM